MSDTVNETVITDENTAAEAGAAEEGKPQEYTQIGDAPDSPAEEAPASPAETPADAGSTALPEGEVPFDGQTSSEDTSGQPLSEQFSETSSSPEENAPEEAAGSDAIATDVPSSETAAEDGAEERPTLMEAGEAAASAPDASFDFMPVAEIGMPAYQSHKVVQAAKILQVIETIGLPTFDLVLEGVEKRARIDNTRVQCFTHDNGSNSLGQRAQAMVGGYLVRYSDGYISWSPAQAFEEGYTVVAE